jgi:ABC-type glutathione transport system ATPase component
VVTLLGRNGAGKTTTLKSIMGIVGKRTGSIRFDGARLIGARAVERPHRAARHRLLPGGARHLRQPRRRGEPAAAADRAPGGCRSSRSSSCSRT